MGLSSLASPGNSLRVWWVHARLSESFCDGSVHLLLGVGVVGVAVCAGSDPLGGGLKDFEVTEADPPSVRGPDEVGLGGQWLHEVSPARSSGALAVVGAGRGIARDAAVTMRETSTTGIAAGYRSARRCAVSSPSTKSIEIEPSTTSRSETPTTWGCQRGSLDAITRNTFRGHFPRVEPRRPRWPVGRGLVGVADA
jgi:hypothetical protein